MNIFFKSELLGSIVEARLDSVFTGETKRKRLTSARAAFVLLKTLGLIEKSSEAMALSKGINGLGEVGYWIIFEANYHHSKPEAEGHFSVHGSGPETKSSKGE